MNAHPAVPPAPTNQTSFWAEVDELASESSSGGNGSSGAEEDDMFDESVEVVRSLDKASVSLLQRRLRIGYTRAARLIDMMEERGIIGPAESGSKPRRVLPNQDD
jgi:S-DNA-T family DNA segregation ATPase FtsK/SpoIIIE